MTSSRVLAAVCLVPAATGSATLMSRGRTSVSSPPMTGGAEESAGSSEEAEAFPEEDVSDPGLPTDSPLCTPELSEDTGGFL